MAAAPYQVVTACQLLMPAIVDMINEVGVGRKVSEKERARVRARDVCLVIQWSHADRSPAWSTGKTTSFQEVFIAVLVTWSTHATEFKHSLMLIYFKDN